MNTRDNAPTGAEQARLEQTRTREQHWQRWGPYLSERQWGTVREDYSKDGSCWTYFPHDHARSRAYRWGEDGLLGITDRQNRLCFALALWNGKDPILKERLFGLTGPEGNHGEDVKELYFYLDSTPTHSYLKALYKYPQREFPYSQLVAENARRGRDEPEFELLDTGVFEEDRYFDVQVEYAKAAPEDILIKITAQNRGPETAQLHLLPTLWFRNTWAWGCVHDGCEAKPRIEATEGGGFLATHPSLGTFRLDVDGSPAFERLFTENETNVARLFGVANGGPTKDAFDEYVVHGRSEALASGTSGTKSAAHVAADLPAGATVELRLRLRATELAVGDAFGPEFEATFAQRIAEADEFYADRIGPGATEDEQRVARQAWAGLLWSKQFYHYVVEAWLDGDPAQPPPPAERLHGRNVDWRHLFNRDVVSMPDKWEYPWYAAWDLAFQMIPFARVDPEFAKHQLLLFLREWYMHPNGQLPAYEFALSDVNPPVHAWACWRVYKMTGARGERDVMFLKRAFNKLLLNFTWWVNRKDIEGNHIFAGGFLGLDNIGVFDRSKPLPNGGRLDQADGTAWMAFYAATMLSMALELARHDVAYDDIASKFFEHFIEIADAINELGGTGLWDEEDGFYYDILHTDGRSIPLRLRSMVGIIPLFAVEVLEDEIVDSLPGFKKRMAWFLKNRKDLTEHIACLEDGRGGHRLLAIPKKERLMRMLRYVFDENEFLSPFGIRSLSRAYAEHPYVLDSDGQRQTVEYVPAESNTSLFGGNSNWRGPIWFPVNFLLVEALERYDHFYGDSVKVELPTGSGNQVTLGEAAAELVRRLSRIFLAAGDGRRPCHGSDARYANDAHWRDLVLFHEYFDGDDGRGVGASHQTGWTAMVAPLVADVARRRAPLPATRERKPVTAKRERHPNVR